MIDPLCQNASDALDDLDEFETVPGVIILGLRMILMLIFVASLRGTMGHENNPMRRLFLLHFGAASLVWFIYLPITAVLAVNISALWRLQFVTGVTRVVDTFAFMVLMHLLWPGRKEQYFILAAQVKGPPTLSRRTCRITDVIVF